MEEQLIIHGISRPAYCEAIGLSKCFEAYAKTVGVDDIESVGFNANSGWVYIALECGVSIGSLLGRQVEFIAYNTNSGHHEKQIHLRAIISQRERRFELQ